MPFFAIISYFETSSIMSDFICVSLSFATTLKWLRLVVAFFLLLVAAFSFFLIHFSLLIQLLIVPTF